eukprot:gene16672-18994_t
MKELAKGKSLLEVFAHYLFYPFVAVEDEDFPEKQVEALETRPIRKSVSFASVEVPVKSAVELELIPTQSVFPYKYESLRTKESNIRPSREGNDSPLVKDIENDKTSLYIDFRSTAAKARASYKRMRTGMKVSGVTSAIELIIGIVVCALYGRSIIIGSIFDCTLRFFFVQNTLSLIHYYDTYFLTMNIGSLCLLSLLDIIFTSYFFSHFTDIGITACSKYSSQGSITYTGDRNYFDNAATCFSSSNKVMWQCYCYDATHEDCSSFTVNNRQASDAATSCKSFITSESMTFFALTVMMVVMSVLHAACYLIAFFRIQQLSSQQQRSKRIPIMPYTNLKYSNY